MKNLLILFLGIIVFYSCKEQSDEFDSLKWRKDVDCLYRLRAFHYLNDNDELIKWDSVKIISMLGEPKGIYQRNSGTVLTYPIEEKFKNNKLDSYKYLSITLKKSKVVNYELVEKSSEGFFRKIISRDLN